MALRRAASASRYPRSSRADCAVEVVREAIGLVIGSVRHPHGKRGVAEQDVACSRRTGRPSVSPMSSALKPVQSTNKSPSISPACSVCRLRMSPFSAKCTCRTSAQHVAHRRAFRNNASGGTARTCRRRGDTRSWRAASNSAVAMVLGARPSSQISALRATRRRRSCARRSWQASVAPG